MNITVVKPGHEVLTVPAELDRMVRHLERCGRVCYKSEGKIGKNTGETFISAIVKSGHESVIEHSVITVKIIGARAMSHQLVRHRLAAYSQESQRYCDYGKLGFQVICPPTIGELPVGTYALDAATGQYRHAQTCMTPTEEMPDGARAERFLRAMNRAYTDYCIYRDEGVPPEDARYVLPNATKTEVVSTYNLRQWRHVFKERALNKHAQWEIRGIMQEILIELNNYLPCMFEDQVDQLKVLQG